MNNGQETPKSNGKLSSILNEEPEVVKSSQESPQSNKKEMTTTVNGGKAAKIKKYPSSKEATSPKNENSPSSKTTNKQTKNSKQTKTTTSSKTKTSTNSRKRPLSPSDSEEGREPSQEPERCKHPKHDEYNKDRIPTTTTTKVNNKRAKLDKSPKLVGMPRRLEGVLNIDRGTKMCSRCINQTDKDPQYTTHKKYISRQTVYKKNERSRLKIDMKGAE